MQDGLFVGRGRLSSIRISQTSTITDTNGNLYSQMFQESSFIEIFVASGIAAGSNTVTVASSGSYLGNLIALEYQNLAATPFDVGTSANAETSPLGTGSIATTVADDLLLVVGQGTGTLTTTGGLPLLGTYVANGGGTNAIWGGAASAVGLYSDSLADTGGGWQTAGIFAFKAATGAGAQTANLQEWQSSSSTVLSGVNGLGQVVMALTTGTSSWTNRILQRTGFSVKNLRPG
jgi:hypothetical protein